MPTSSSTSAAFLQDHGLLDTDLGAALEALRGETLFARGLHQLATLRRRGAALGEQALPQRLAALREDLDETIALWPALLQRMHSGGAAHSDEARWAAQLARHLFLVAHGQAVAAADAACAVRGAFARPRPALDALAMALDSAWRLACVHAHLYTALPAGFWADCHRLHALAQAQRLEDASADPARATPGVAYRRLLLLGMTGINRYDPARIDAVLQQVAEAAPRLGLRALRGRAADSMAAFRYRRESDRPPTYTELPSDEPAGTQSLVQVEVERMAQDLDRRIGQLQRRAMTSLQHLQLLVRLRQEWVHPPQRRPWHRRRERHGRESVQLTSGMPGCWQVISGTAADGTAPDWTESPGTDAATTPALAVAETVPPVQLAICNISPTGLQLMGDPGRHVLAAGELVAYRHGDKPWRLGLVRWVRQHTEACEVDCGIEVIGVGADSILVAPVMSRGPDGFQPALRVATRNVIVVAGRYFHPYREFLVRNGRSQTLVRALRLMLESTQYQVIECRLSAGGQAD